MGRFFAFPAQYDRTCPGCGGRTLSTPEKLMRITHVSIDQEYEFASDGWRPSHCVIKFDAVHDTNPEHLTAFDQHLVDLPAVGLVDAICTSVSVGWDATESSWIATGAPDRHRAVTAVRDAWIVTGPAPEYHEAMKRRLRSEWPVLAAALDELAGSTSPG